MQNRLLSFLSAPDLVSIMPYLAQVALVPGAILHEPEEPIATIYFPLSGAISLLGVMKRGDVFEVAGVGREGAVGLTACLGRGQASTRAIVQAPGFAKMIPLSVVRDMIGKSEHMRDLMLRYAGIVVAQGHQLAACSLLHSVEQRVARWLLQLSDRVGGANLPMTQNTISQMLSVRRTTITRVARKLQRDKLIAYRRGHIMIREAEGLQALACECYETCRRAEAVFERHDPVAA